jgi:putative ABC transport system substrate-binding protein
MMQRRHLVALLGGATAWPHIGHGQQPAMPVIGFLSGASPGPFAGLVAAFRLGLNDTGFVEGQNVAIEYRWAEGRFDRLPQMANDLVARQVAALVATAGDRSALSAKAATATIPIVFSSGGDPVATGLVASLSRPGGNLTGVSLFTTLLEAKRLGLLHEALPAATNIAYLVNPGNSNTQALVRDAEDGARRAGVRLVVVQAQAEGEFDAAFAGLVQQRASALAVGTGAFFNSQRERLVALAARHKMPAIYEFREFALAGGLMSYGTHLGEMYRQIGVYTGRILKGAKPGELPVLQPTRFELVINLKTAKALGITIPQGMLLRADEVIQ